MVCNTLNSILKDRIEKRKVVREEQKKQREQREKERAEQEKVNLF